MRVAAMGDLHCMTASSGMVRKLLEGVGSEADVLLLAGDLTNMGMPEEMEVLLEDLSFLAIPVIAVIGNHDHESDQADMLVRLMEDAGICVLECSTCEIDDIGFVGTKGFCGGFGRRRVETFGERALKTFVRTSIDEAERLSQSLSSLNVRRKVAVMHYSPIRETLAGESFELYPFLGTSLLADALDKHSVDVVFHGHAHHGAPEGKTPGGIPVYNVARFVMTRFGPKAYRVYDL